MQGTFVGADWDSALDPGPDDEAQQQQRSDAIERELEHLTRIRNNNPLPPPQDPLRYTQVFPPTAHFTLQGYLFYILNSHLLENEYAQAGEYGHYLVTMTDIVAKPHYARPIHVKQELPQNRQFSYQTAPGMQHGDDRYRPDPRFCVSSVHYILPNPPGFPPVYYEIGLQRLKNSLEQAEALDLAFARRMEGLGNVASQVCQWCLFNGP